MTEQSVDMVDRALDDMLGAQEFWRLAPESDREDVTAVLTMKDERERE